jgi:hypothetical protein
MMLGEEIFPVEIIVRSVSAGVSLETRIAGSSIAAVEAELEMLRGNVAFPFIFGGEATVAAVVGEGADERSAFTILVAGSFSWNGFGLAFDRRGLSLRGFEDSVVFNCGFHEGVS